MLSVGCYKNVMWRYWKFSFFQKLIGAKLNLGQKMTQFGCLETTHRELTKQISATQVSVVDSYILDVLCENRAYFHTKGDFLYSPTAPHTHKHIFIHYQPFKIEKCECVPHENTKCKGINVSLLTVWHNVVDIRSKTLSVRHDSAREI